MDFKAKLLIIFFVEKVMFYPFPIFIQKLDKYENVFKNLILSSSYLNTYFY